MEMIAMDCHKRYSQACVQDEMGKIIFEGRIQHDPVEFRAFLGGRTPGSPVAIETVGNWYWIVDEIEKAGLQPLLVHARLAKLLMGLKNKTDKLDARGLNRLQRVGTLPTVWIASADIRDKRELPRTRMLFAQLRTRLKNRIHSVLEKYGLGRSLDAASDIFGKRVRKDLERALGLLPEHAGYTAGLLLGELDRVQRIIYDIEKLMKAVFEDTAQVRLLQTLPGVAWILSVVIWLEVGDIERFGGPDRFASYCGTVPRVHSSGGKTRFGPTCPDVNHYLKWAYAEAANSVGLNHRRLPDRHVSQLFGRIRSRRGSAKAVGAVSRHLAEATYWMLRRQEAYRERGVLAVSSKGA